MHRLFLFFLLSLALGGLFLGDGYAQSETDAYRLTQRELNGSARYVALGGAFTALGGDISALEQNPASIGVFHKSRFFFTGQLNHQNSTSSWLGNINQDNSTRVKLGQMGFVGSFFNPRSGNGFSMAVNVGSPFYIDRNISSRNNTPQTYSLADYVALTTPDNLSSEDLTERQVYDPYQEAIPWFSILANAAGWIRPTNKDRGPFETTFFYPKEEESKEYVPYGPATSSLDYNEMAALRETDFAFGYNYQDRIYLGFSMKLSSVKYSLSTKYDESFMDGDYLSLNNHLRSSGYGFSGSFGIIAQPLDGLKLGVAFHTPSILYLKDRFNADATSRYSYATDPNGKPYPKEMWIMKGKTPQDAYAKYRLLSPSRFSLGIAYTLPKVGLISLDYGFISYGSMKLYDTEERPFEFDNKNIRKHFTLQQNFRIGVECLLIPKVSLRLGYAYKSSAIKSSLLSPINDKNIAGENNGQVLKEQVLVAGTLPHYILPGDTHTMTCGIGYNFSKKISLDGAFLYSKHSDKLISFPTLQNNIGVPVAFSSQPIDVAQNNFRVYLTMGFSF